MADVLYFSRDTKLFLEIGSDVWEIPILDGYSFSQATNATEIVLEEMADSSGNSRRGRKYFNDSYAPAEWEFTTYVRPFKSAGSGSGAADDTENVHHSVEEPLWALMVGDAEYEDFAFTGITSDTTDSDIDFDASNKVTLGTCNLYFVLGACTGVNTKVYKIAQAVVNQVSIDFDINGIASLVWSGMGSIITNESSAPAATVYEAINSTSNFIRNKLTSLSITGAGSGNFQSTYDITLTGGNVTINNNIEYITPETLCTVNQPLGHITGTRSVSGNFTCYLGINTGSVDQSADLWQDLISSTTVVTNSFGLTFKVGGASTPRMEIAIPKAHLEIPTHSIDNVISLDTNFYGLPSTIDETDEVTIKYVGA